MNKDLDDRLIPNGEYRDAHNISVGKSEDDDIGALETILGNTLVPNTTLGIANLKVIGTHTDKGNNRMFVFLTDNTSLVPGTNHFIYQLTEPDNYIQLVTGAFLNFSQSSLITGISLIENLLFFTDNRNQPRKINVEKAAENSDYYNDESQISVAKYNPYEPINLLKKVEAIAGVGSAGINIVLATANTAIVPGMSLVSTSFDNAARISPTEYLYVTAVNGTAITLCTTCSPGTDPVDGDKLYFVTTTMTGQDISPYFDGVAMPATTTWPGDPDYLESRYVRFSYRFQYDDGEYSIMAPFTQIAYIPKQKGYFLEGDEDEAYKSTILQWMENGVQNVELSILLPDNISNLQTLSTSSYKIISIDVLYKESDSRAVKVLDRVPLGTVANTTIENVYTYKYQSTKPFRTLPESQTVRVFDKVPVLAQAQETAGNRIIYGNFKDKYTPPNTVSYKVAVAPKLLTTKYDNWVEYPNHSIKQNRNYQVGFILADKFGRQSSVILADVEGETTVLDGVAYGGSTVYSPYNNSAESATNPVKDWFGDALRVIIESPINETVNTETGTPGLYANARGTGFDVNGATATVNNTVPTASTYEFTPVAITNIPQVGDYLRGEYKDFVKVTAVSSAAGTPVVVANWGTNTGFTNTSTTCPDFCRMNMAAVLVITNGGTGYSVGNNLTTTTLTGIGGATGGSAILKVNILSVDGTGAITSVIVGGYTTSGGRDYFQNDTIQIDQAGGSGSIITIQGPLTTVQVGDVITTSIVANAQINGGVITEILTPVQGGPTMQEVDFASWGITLDITTNPGVSGPQGNATTTYPLTFTRTGGTVYTVTCDGPINKDIYELTGDAGAQIKYAYTLNSKGWYSYKVVVKQNEQEYYNVYLPGIVKGYPFQDPAATNIVKFPTDTTNTSNIVLFNDNINKVPRDLTEVGPDQKQYRSSVQLFGRVENIMTAAAPTTDPGVPNNHQFFPNTTTNIVPLSDTAISISSATDSNMAFEVFQSYDSNDPILYSTLTLTGQNSLFQLDTNPLIARLSTSQDIGAASLVAAGTATPSMTPFLAVYETEPVDSLLDIYWETTTVGLIADLNSDINTSFNGAVGFSSYTWTQPESLPSGSTFLTSIKPIDSNGAVISGITTLTNFVSTPAGIAPVGVAPFTAAEAVGYSFKTTSDFVYDSNSSTTAVFTLSMNITDDTGTTSGTLQLTGGLGNTQPVISNVTAGELPAITNQDTTSGTIATLTGVNGSAFTTSNQQQLQWTITAGNTLGYFSLGLTTGVLTQTSASAVVHNLTIRLTDANASTGSLFIEANQQITVSSSVVGFPFSAGQADGNIAQVCPTGNPPGTDPIAPTCGQYTYWNTTRNSGTPQVNDIISTTGPTITLAGRGYYSFNCLNGPGSGTSTGTNRLVFKIEQANYPTLDGKVTYVGFCGDSNMP
jgi:hypothetical protein